MAESTLSLTNQELEAEVGHFAGFGRGANYGEPAWSTRNQLTITNCVKAGLRMFYFPTAVPGDMASYDWSFIRPTRQVTFITGDTSVALPDDFGGLEGDVRYVDSGRWCRDIKQTNENRVAEMLTRWPDVVGLPEYCAVRQNSTTGVYRGQRATLLLYPKADQDYTLEFQMYLNPDCLSASFPYALGGATHSETIKAACKAVYERDEENVQNGPQFQYFVERMRASVSLDRRNKGQTFGVNNDPGYNRQRWNGRYLGNTQIPITWAGQDPG